MKDPDAEAFGFYDDPKRREPAPGPPRRRPERALTQHVPVRFPAPTIETVRELAEADGMTVSSWIRRAVDAAVRTRAGGASSHGDDVDDPLSAVQRLRQDVEELAATLEGAPSNKAVATARGGRRDKLGRAFKGSQLQVQIYVNRRTEELTARVLAGLPSLAKEEPAVRWISPLETERFAEYQDKRFLKAVGLGAQAAKLRSFWPARGPVWDALAVADLPSGRHGIVLAEAKSYPGELLSRGTAASKRSRSQIERAVSQAQQWIGLSPDPALWLSAHYQMANRIAHLLWLREVADVDAWLVHLLIVNDMTHVSTSEAEWNVALDSATQALGLKDVDLPHVGHVYLEARDRRELLVPSRAA